MASANASPQTGSVRLWDRLSIGTKRVIWAWTFLALPIIFYAGIRFRPTFQAFWLSLTNWDLLRPALERAFNSGRPACVNVAIASIPSPSATQ